MSVNLYDLLDVAPDASPEQIRRAWKEAIADLDPGDRRFRVYNSAAEVLLDPMKRAEHDAGLVDVALPVEEPMEEPADEAPAGPAERPAPRAASAAASPAESTTASGPAEVVRPGAPTGSEVSDGPAGRAVPTWLLAAVGAVAAVVVAVTAWAWTATGEEGDPPGEERVQEAVAVAEEAAVPMLSFDYRSLDQDIVAAESFMTGEYAAQHSQLMNDLRGDIAAQETVVDAQVMGSAVVRTTDAGVDVLVLVNQITQKATGEPFLLPVWATLQMVQEDGAWRVDNIVNRGAVAEAPEEGGGEPSAEPTAEPSAEPTAEPSS